MKIIISNATILAMNRYGLNFFEKLNLMREVLPKLKKNGFVFYNDVIHGAQIFIGRDLKPLKKFMDNYKHGIPNTKIPLVLNDTALNSE